MTKYILIILMLLAPIAGASADNLTPSPISIVPCPVRVVPGKGNFTFSDKTVFSVENHEQAVIARNFIDLFKKSSGIIPQLTMGSSEKSHVRFTTDSSLKVKHTCWKLPAADFGESFRYERIFLRIADDPFTAATCYRRQSTGKVP